jgi:hypothetical protein
MRVMSEGVFPPITLVDGTDSVEVSNADVSLVGHGYYNGVQLEA